MHERPANELMTRFFKYIALQSPDFEDLEPDYLSSAAGIGKYCYMIMFNRQRNAQRSVEKDQVKSGRTARKEDARTLFGDAQDSESDGKSSDKSRNDQAEVQMEESASEAAEIEAPQPSPTKSRCTTRSQNKPKPKVGKLAEAKKYILSQFDLLDEDSFTYMFVELQDAKVKLMVEYPFVKEVIVKRY